MDHQVPDIKTSSGGRGWSSGTAWFGGALLRWEAYRVDQARIRVMLACEGRWLKPHTLSAARAAIRPSARAAMQG
jgi:hypothetical protein